MIAWSVFSFAVNCSADVSASKICVTAMPSSSRLATDICRAVETPSTIAETARATTRALAIVIHGGSWLLPASVMANAAPKAAAGETPSVKGLTSGLRSRPCMMTPDSDRPAPAANASSTRGRRSSVTMP